MSERTVAEILGWRLESGYGHESAWYDPNGKYYGTEPDYDCDDMRAWLREHWASWFVESISSSSVLVRLTLDHQAIRTRYDGETLRDVFEQAVRSVDQRERNGE